MIKNAIIFFKKPLEYAEQIEKTNVGFFKRIIIILVISKIFFDLISSHNFPPEFSFEKAGIISPNALEYLITNLLILFINFFIFAPIMLFNILKANFFFKFIISNIVMLSFISLPLILEKCCGAVIISTSFFSLKIIYILSAVFIPLLLWVLISKNNNEKYILLLKIIISVQIISIISEPFIFLSEISKSELFFTLTNLIFGICYIIYFVKLLKSRFDISINRIVFFSIASISFSFIYGYVLYRSEIFSSNIIKLLLY